MLIRYLICMSCKSTTGTIFDFVSMHMMNEQGTKAERDKKINERHVIINKFGSKPVSLTKANVPSSFLFYVFGWNAPTNFFLSGSLVARIHLIR